MLNIFENFADLITYTLLNLNPETKLANVINFFIEDATKILTLIALIIFLMSLFRNSFSQEKVRNYIKGKPIWVAYTLAVIIGWLTPFCYCSSIPLFLGFVAVGVPFGVALTFLAVSPMPVETVAILGTTTGFSAPIIYMAIFGFLGIVFGLLFEKLGWEKYINKLEGKDNHEHEHCHCGCDPEGYNLNPTCKIGSFHQKVSDSFCEVKTLLKRIWVYVILGVLVGAIMESYIPSEFFSNYANGNELLSIPFAIILGIPFHTSTIGMIPVMEALYLKGVSIGTILTFMMSISVLSLPEILILKNILGVQILVRLIGFLTLALLIIGLMFNLFA